VIIDLSPNKEAGKPGVRALASPGQGQTTSGCTGYRLNAAPVTLPRGGWWMQQRIAKIEEAIAQIRT
jgi:hypothetical protein